MSALLSPRNELYEAAVLQFGRALGRLARGYEPDIDKSRDLLQEIHFALWQSFDHFNGRCSLRTWVYRVAHNTATSHVSRKRRNAALQVSLDELEIAGSFEDQDSVIDKQRAFDRLLALIQKLKPLDKQIILLYLDGVDASSIGEITGMSSVNVATKIHRIKGILSRRSSGRVFND
jgi:RNA polymerase sigma-70 factor (ECF subfamily)